MLKFSFQLLSVLLTALILFAFIFMAWNLFRSIAKAASDHFQDEDKLDWEENQK